MNKRILHAINAAGFHQPEIERLGIEDKFERFAELIIDECIRYVNEDYQRDFDVLWREHLSKSIQQHFGIT